MQGRQIVKVLGMCAVWLLASLPGAAQDTLKIVSYNTLNYQSSRDAYYRTVLRNVRPDVLVVEEVSTQASVDNFYNGVVNAVFPGEFSKGTFVYRAGDTNQEIYYRTSKFTFVSNTPIHTDLRDINEFKLYNPTAADTLRIYALHLKASSGTSNEVRRASEIDNLRSVTNALPVGKHFMVLGDFNIYSSNEAAYQKLLQDNVTDDGHFVDALQLTGTWNDVSYSRYHTQSTRIRTMGDGGATGGLNDRFDMILFSRATVQPGGRFTYLDGSMTPVGNDGLHYRDSVCHQPNYAVPDSVALALTYASDHLPVSARIVVTSAPQPQQSVSTLINGWNLVSVPRSVQNPSPAAVFPGAVGGTIYGYQASAYSVPDSLHSGEGYWALYNAAGTNTITGGSITSTSVTVTVPNSWVLLGSLTNAVPTTALTSTPDGAIVAGTLYGWDGVAYVPPTSFEPGKGYWAFIATPCTLRITSP